MKERLRTLGCLLALVALVAAFFGPTLWGGCSLVPADILHQIILPYANDVKCPQVQNHYAYDPVMIDYPWARFWQQTVRSGQWPVWNPFILGGHPHAAEGMPAICSPFKLLLLALPAERALSLVWVAQLALAGLWMFGFLRELGRSRPAAFVGACAWSLNSAFLMWYWRAPAVFCWAPLVLWLMERSARRQSWGHALAAATALGVAFLCGNIQAAAHLIFLCAGYALLTIPWRDRAMRRRLVAQWAAVFVVAGLIAAVQWLPTLELMGREAYGSVQMRGPRFNLRNALLGLPALVTFVFPAVTGSTETFDLLKAAGASRGDFTGYIGLVPVGLLLAAAVADRGTRTRAMLWLMAAVTVLLFTPLARYLYHRFFIVAVFAATVLAAHGLDIVLEPSEQQRRAIGRALAGLLAVSLFMLVAVGTVQAVITCRREAVTASAWRFIQDEASKHPFGHQRDWMQQRVGAFLDHYRVSNPSFWLPVACLAVTALAWHAYARGRFPRVGFGCVAAGMTVLDLMVMGRPLAPQVDLRKYPLQAEHPLLAPVLADNSLFRVQVWESPGTAFLLPPNWLLRASVQDVRGNFSLAPESLEQLTPRGEQKATPLFHLQNVKYLIADDAVDIPSDTFELAASQGRFRVWRNLRCLPRALWVPRAETVIDRKQLLARMRTEPFDPRAVVLLEESLSVLTNGTTPATGEAQVAEYTPTRVRVRVRADSPGWLLLADNWYPGWQATVDGRPAKLYRANWVLRAVFVPAGLHEVEFQFAPATFRAGLGITLATLAGLAVAGATIRLVHRRI